MTEEFFTVQEAAERLSVSPRTIQRYCKQGRLNYKWVTGKRHRELRIIPPIPVSDLPGVKKRGIGSIDIVSTEEMHETVDRLTVSIEEKNARIEELERKVANLEAIATGQASDGTRSTVLTRAEELVGELEKVRPVEQKLILKMAKEIKAHSGYLKSLGMKDAPE